MPELENLIRKENVKDLIKALKDKNPDVRKIAVEALGKIGDPRAVEPLIQTLKGEDRWVRKDLRENSAWVLVVSALVNIGKPAVEPLTHALKDEVSDVRETAVKALGKIGDRRAVEPLIQALKIGSRPIRRDAAWALGDIGDARASEFLVQTLKNKGEDRWVRRAAAVGLGRIGDEKDIEPLIQILKEEDPYTRDVRSGAVEALEMIGAPAIKSLTQFIKDKKTRHEARGYAEQALKNINRNRNRG